MLISFRTSYLPIPGRAGIYGRPEWPHSPGQVLEGRGVEPSATASRNHGDDSPRIG